MSIVNNSEEGGAPVCPDDVVSNVGSACSVSNAGQITATSCGCSTAPDCGCVLNTAATETILNRDACRTPGCTTAAPSTACSECFRGTTRSCEGYIMTKASPGDACLQHLIGDRSRFVVNGPEGASQTDSPEVAVPSANGYVVKADGGLLTDSSGDPVLDDAPEFTKLWISGVVDRGEDQLLVLNAPNSSESLHLVAKDGCFSLAPENDIALCASVLPDKVAAGRLLVVDRTSSCDGDEWCVKELELPLEDAECAHLIVTQDANGDTQIGYRVPTMSDGFLRVNPEDPCNPTAGDTLSAGEATQFTGFLDQLFCAPEFAGTVAVDRVMICGTRTEGVTVTEGAQPVTLAELSAAIDDAKATDPDANTAPVDESDVELVDGLPYAAIYVAASKSFVYRLQGFNRVVGPTAIGDYKVSTVGASGSTPFSSSLATLGVVTTIENYADVRFTIDVRARSASTSAEIYGYASVGGSEVGWAGAKSQSQPTFSTGSDVISSENTFTVRVPIVTGSFAFVMGHVYNASTTENEIAISATLVGVEYVPV